MSGLGIEPTGVLMPQGARAADMLGREPPQPTTTDSLEQHSLFIVEAAVVTPLGSGNRIVGFPPPPLCLQIPGEFLGTRQYYGGVPNWLETTAA